MRKINSKSKVIALSAVAVSSVALVSYAGAEMLQNKADNNTAINLNIDKIDRDTVKISVENLAYDIKSLQLSLKIDGAAKFAGEDSIKWLVKNQNATSTDANGLQMDTRISNDGKYLDLIMVSNEEFSKNGGRVDICEIDVSSVGNLEKAASGYKIVPRENNGASYTYVISNTNKSKSGTDMVNASDEMLKINTAPTVELKEISTEEFTVKGGKIIVNEGYDFSAGFEKNKESFVVVSDTDADDTHTVSFEGNVNTAVPGSYNIKVVATDSFKDKGEVSAIVEVKPEVVTQKPVITGVKESHTMNAGEVFNPMEGISATDAKGNKIEVVVGGNFNLDEEGEYTITYTATDKWGNVSTETTKLIVIKDEAPVIEGVVDVTIERHTKFDPLEGVVVRDDKDKNIKLKVDGEVNSAVTGEYKLAYSSTDSAGNTTRAQRTVTVVPKVTNGSGINNAPVLSGVENKSIKQGSEFDPLSGVSAKDREDGNLTDEIQVEGRVEVNTPGKYELKYTVADKNGAKTTKTIVVTVLPKSSVVNQAPTISGVVDKTIVAGSEFNPFAGISASDKEDGDLTKEIQIEGRVEVNTPGAYILKYTVSDKDGAKSTKIATITVLQKQSSINNAPVLSGVENKSIKQGSKFDPLSGVTASDKEDGNLTSKIQVEGKVEVNTPGKYELKYTVADKNGAKTTKTIIVTVLPKSSVVNQAPTISGVVDKTILVGAEFDALEGITVTDNEDGDLTKEITVDGKVDTSKSGVYTLKYVVTDKQGAKSTKLATITVVKEEVPEVVPPTVEDILDPEVVEIKSGTGEKDSPLQLTLKSVKVEKLNSLLDDLKLFNAVVDSIEEHETYKVFNIRLKNNSQVSSMTRVKANEAFFIKLRVENKDTELLEAMMAFAKVEEDSTKPEEKPDKIPEIKPEVTPETPGNIETPNTENPSDPNKGEGQEKPSSKPGNDVQTSDASFLGYVGIAVAAVSGLIFNRRMNK